MKNITIKKYIIIIKIISLRITQLLISHYSQFVFHKSDFNTLLYMYILTLLRLIFEIKIR